MNTLKQFVAGAFSALIFMVAVVSCSSNSELKTKQRFCFVCFDTDTESKHESKKKDE